MLGAELKKERMKAGLSQEALAARAQIDRTYLSELENDKKSPTIDMLFRICRALEVKASTLIRRVEEHA